MITEIDWEGGLERQWTVVRIKLRRRAFELVRLGEKWLKLTAVVEIRFTRDQDYLEFLVQGATLIFSSPAKQNFVRVTPESESTVQLTLEAHNLSAG